MSLESSIFVLCYLGWILGEVFDRVCSWLC